LKPHVENWVRSAVDGEKLLEMKIMEDKYGLVAMEKFVESGKAKQEHGAKKRKKETIYHKAN
jgi:hypothetical protein